MALGADVREAFPHRQRVHLVDSAGSIVPFGPEPDAATPHEGQAQR